MLESLKTVPFKTLLFLYKWKHELVVVVDMVRTISKVPNYGTRNKGNLCVYFSSSKFGANQVFIKGFLFINSVPLVLKHEVDCNRFNILCLDFVKNM